MATSDFLRKLYYTPPPPTAGLTKAEDGPDSPEVMVGSAWGPDDKTYQVADLALVTAMDYAAIRAIATHASTVDLDLYEYVDGAKGVSRVARDRPESQILRRPNAKQTMQEFIEACVFYQELFGHAPLHVPKSGDPPLATSAYPIRPDRLEVHDAPGPDGAIQYVFTDYNSRKVDTVIPGSDVAIVRHFSPIHPIWGYSPGEASRKSLLLDFHAHQFNVSFFANHAMPGVILKTDRLLTRIQKKQLRASWKTAFGGSARAHGVAVLTSGMDATPVSPRHSDMEFSQLLNHAAREILATRGVPPIVLGIPEGGGGKGSTQEQRHVFLTGTLMPILNRILNALNTHVFLPMGVFVLPDFDGYMTTTETLHQRRIEIRGYWRDGIVTRDEARALLALDPAPRDGDVYFQELNPNVGGVGPSAATTTSQTPNALDRPDAPDVSLLPANGNGADRAEKPVKRI